MANMYENSLTLKSKGYIQRSEEISHIREEFLTHLKIPNNLPPFKGDICFIYYITPKRKYHYGIISTYQSYTFQTHENHDVFKDCAQSI